MKKMTVQLVTGHVLEIEDVRMSHCACFSRAGDRQIIGLGRDQDGHHVVYVWREYAGEWNYHFHISLSQSMDHDTAAVVSAKERIYLALGQHPVAKDLTMLIVGP